MLRMRVGCRHDACNPQGVIDLFIAYPSLPSPFLAFVCVVARLQYKLWVFVHAPFLSMQAGCVKYVQLSVVCPV